MAPEDWTPTTLTPVRQTRFLFVFFRHPVDRSGITRLDLQHSYKTSQDKTGQNLGFGTCLMAPLMKQFMYKFYPINTNSCINVKYNIYEKV